MIARIQPILVTLLLCAGPLLGPAPGLASGQPPKQSPATDKTMDKGGKVSPGRCRPGSTKQVDKVGQEDRCYRKVDFSCGPNRDVSVDSFGYADQCPPRQAMPGATPSTGPAACPDQYERKVQQGRDACEYSKPPACPAGTGLQVQTGPDVCR
jgi:hypothetical protein